MSSYNRFARYTFKTPDGQHFVMDARTKSRKPQSLQKADKVAKTLVRSEYERWTAAEARKKMRARNAVPTLWTNSAIKTPADLEAWMKTRDGTESRGARTRARTKMSAKTGGEDVDAGAKRKVKDAIGEERVAKTAQVDQTSEHKAKRKATSAVDDERMTKKVKTQHAAAILKVDGGATGAKRVRSCAPSQETRARRRAPMAQRLVASCV